MNEFNVQLLLGILLGCVVASGFFAGAETALMALNRFRLKHLRRGHRGARLALQLLEKPDRLLGLILVGNTLFNLLAASVATALALQLWGGTGIAIATFAATFVVLVFAEVIPKTLGALYPERLAFPASYLLFGLGYFLHPFVWTVNTAANAVLRTFGIDARQRHDDTVASEELRTVVTEAGPMIPSRHKRMLLNILDLEDVTVDDVMVPRHEIYGVDLDDEDTVIIARLRASGHTRVVLYRGELDHILGLLHLRNVCQFVQGDRLDREAMQRVADEAYFVPESTPLNTQLLNFQKQKRRIGIVVDEYGSVRGLVTIEDILEEIVGEFTSNLGSTSTAPEIVAQVDGSFLIDGAASIRDINRALHWSLPIDGPRTLNGLLLEHLEALPEANVGLSLGPYRFEIVQLRGKLIESVRALVAGEE